MALRIRRGSDEARQGVRFELGELVWTTNGQQLWVGDGATNGGVPVVGSNIVGYGLTYNGTSKRIEVSGLSTDDVSEGTNRKYFSQELAQDAAALLFSTGVHTGVQFQYDDNLGRINATVDASAFIDLGILSVGSDTSPELGGNLVLSGFDITGTGNIDITGTIETVGDITVTGNLDITGAIDTGSMTIDNNVLSASSNNIIFGLASNQTTVTVNNNALFIPSIVYNGLCDGPQVAPSQEFRTSRGTISAPLAVQPLDGTGLITSFAYTGVDYQITSLIGSFIDPNGSVGAGTTTGMIGLVTLDGAGASSAKGIYINRKGWLSVGLAITDDAKAHVDINGVMRLAKQTAAPTAPFEGMIAVADRVTWDPAAKGTGGSYPAYYDGSVWTALI
jgi:hypothetical protein